MSITDETWNRPTCIHCGDEIPYGEKGKHGLGRCTEILSGFYDRDDTRPYCVHCKRKVAYGGLIRTMPDRMCIDCHNKQVKELKNMKTKTTSTEAGFAYMKAAEEILDMMEREGFTTETEVNPEIITDRIMDIIIKNVERIDEDNLPCPPCNAMRAFRQPLEN